MKRKYLLYMVHKNQFPEFIKEHYKSIKKSVSIEKLKEDKEHLKGDIKNMIDKNNL